MRAERDRTKKLIVAFHFHFANQAAWKCDDCRKQRLEQQRRCGFLPAPATPARPVWIRRGAIAMECPKTLVTGDSAAWLDAFFAWKIGGGGPLMDLPARTADAFLTLEREWRAELRHADE